MNDTTMTDAPTELRTFLVADIRGYTRYTEQRGDEAAGRLAAKFAELARQAAEAHGGRLLELRGDEALAVFGSARQALRAAVDLKERCHAAMEADPSLPLTIGIGLDAGEAVPIEGGYRGAALNLAARLCGIADPGQVLVGEGLVHLARKTEGLTFVELKSVSLKGFEGLVRVFEVLPEGVEAVWLPSTERAKTPPARSAVPLPMQRDLETFIGDRAKAMIEGPGRELTDAINAAVNERLSRKAQEIRARTEQERRSREPIERSAPLPPGRQLVGVTAILVVMVVAIVVVLIISHVL